MVLKFKGVLVCGRYVVIVLCIFIFMNLVDVDELLKILVFEVIDWGWFCYFGLVCLIFWDLRFLFDFDICEFMEEWWFL